MTATRNYRDRILMSRHGGESRGTLVVPNLPEPQILYLSVVLLRHLSSSMEALLLLLLYRSPLSPKIVIFFPETTLSGPGDSYFRSILGVVNICSLVVSQATESQRPCL